MIVPAPKTVYTPADLLALGESGKTYELVDGNLVERKVGVLSSRVGGKLYRRVELFSSENDLGEAWPADNGLQCFPNFPNKLRKPDLSFVRRERVTPELFHQGYLRIVPDLVAEVISPHDTAEELDEKITEYQELRVPLIWIVNPEARTVRVYRANGTSSLLHETDELQGEDILPGFRCPVRDLFPALPVAPPASTPTTSPS